MQPCPPISTIPLFPELHDHLIYLLEGLDADQWHAPTVLKGWNVKDIASHIADGHFRRIALYRDHYAAPDIPRIDSYQSLVSYLNELNRDWVTATRRVSPATLLDWIRQAGPEVCRLFQALPPDADAVFPVAWAGQDVSPNWFHIAREYTELWHHQQQIRLAVGEPETLMSVRLYQPLIDTFMRALPHTYRLVEAAEGTLVVFRVTGLPGAWYLHYHAGRWQLAAGSEQLLPAAEVELDGPAAWRIFTKGIPALEAASLVTIRGNAALGEPVLSMCSVMA
ncbi:maleylpyruvate isomerase N-terminal domain-containing protein [Dyadobacter sandarakinus]|uniref:Maleylpyruvate isomerase N-terminal domain-containing protein n=1 Tax=Dyadobacter sandarakinus TaxID=2747268 RepID=A0ABX7IEX4_9BACT|nr:maleylpyruvate isomerase N-terminal domain-containing protein [Dyadobacter sandarakinus]